MCIRDSVSASLTFLKLNSNSIGSEGATAIGDALRVNASLTSLWLFNNDIGDESATAIADALRVNVSLTSLDLSHNELEAEAAKALAPALAANASLTKILVSGNQLGDEGTTILCDALRESTASKVEEFDLCGNKIGPDGAKAIAALCAVRGSLTSLDVTYNHLGEEGRAMVNDAVKGREDFTLKL